MGYVEFRGRSFYDGFEAIRDKLGWDRKPKYDFPEVAKIISVETGRDRVETRFLQVEAAKTEVGQARRGSRMAK